MLEDIFEESKLSPSQLKKDLSKYKPTVIATVLCGQRIAPTVAK